MTLYQINLGDDTSSHDCMTKIVELYHVLYQWETEIHY